MSNLKSMQILVTRPEETGLALVEAINAHGGIAYHFPTITFLPPQDIIAYEHALHQLPQQDWLIFVSPYAVKTSITVLLKNMSDNTHIAAVGLGTKRALEAAGCKVTAIPQHWSSEGVLALPEFQQIKDKKIAIVRGEGGRQILDTVLVARGAEVLPVIAYRRSMPSIDTEPVVRMVKNNSIDGIVCTSFDGVRHLRLLLGEAIWPALSQVDLVVVSERIKKLAQDLGFQRIWVARNASHEAILACCVEIRNQS